MSWKKGILAVGIGLGVFLSMRYLFPILFPFFMGWLLALLVLPMARWVERHWKIRRGIAGSFLLGGLLLLFFFFLWKGSGLLLKQSRMIFENLGFLREGCERVLQQSCVFVEKYTGILASDSEHFLLEHLSRWGNSFRENLQPVAVRQMFHLLQGAVAFFGGLVVIFVFGCFLIQDLERWRKRMEKNAYLRHVLNIIKRIGASATAYVKAQGLIMLLVIVICMVGLWLLKNPYFFAGGLMIGILDALPFFGTGTVLIPWAVILVIQGNYVRAVFYFLLFLVCHFLRECLEPRLLGDGLGIHPALILAAVYLGIVGYGLFGFILGPFSVLIFREIWRECEELRKTK